MMNPFKDVHWNPTFPEKRKFAKSLIIGFPIIAILLAIINRFSTHAWNPFFLYLGLIGFTAGVILWLAPQIARPFYVIWYFIACCIGIVIGNLIFILIFYLAFTPLGLLRRLAFAGAMRKGFDKSKSTYWEPAPKGVDARRYYRQF